MEHCLCPREMSELATLNIVYEVIMNKRFKHRDTVAKQILDTIIAANRDLVLGVGPLELFPWLRCIPGLTYLDLWTKASNTCYDYFKVTYDNSGNVGKYFHMPPLHHLWVQAEVLEKMRQSGSYRTEPTDFADYFLPEIDKRRDMDHNYITGKFIALRIQREIIGCV